jgi:hypothetical protein
MMNRFKGRLIPCPKRGFNHIGMFGRIPNRLEVKQGSITQQDASDRAPGADMLEYVSEAGMQCRLTRTRQR